MKKETIKTVKKKWGEEIVLVNRPDYCGKLLIVDKGAKSSYHYHKKKRETFFAIEGYVSLIIEGSQYVLAPFTRPKTIDPGDKHSFEGISQAIVLEISTQHDDKDVFRLSKSTKAERGINDEEGI